MKKFPCPKCSTEIPVGQAYCTSCGERFEYKAPGDVSPSQASPMMPYQPVMVPPESHHRHGFLAFLGIVGAILCLGAVFFLVIMGAGSESTGSGKGFSLKQSSPGPSAPPLTIKPEPEETPVEEELVEVTGASRYTKAQVVAVAKRISPECRRDKYGWAGSICLPGEAAKPIYDAKYTGNGVWSVTKTCPVNSKYDGTWNFYESTGEMVKTNK